MSEQMKKEFEAWAQRHHGVYSIGAVNNHYSNPMVADDWEIWKESRRSMIIKLPDLCFFVGDDAMIYVEEMKQRLSSSGVRYE